ncbi:MAG: glycosyltransferase family 39 protein [Pirellulaceae bacterium]|nr:glycosyltransferase family 39 protein [Pirellulaceae bacterium]
MTDRLPAWRITILVSLTAIVMFSFLGSARLWDRDEPRNARASQEMLERGDWIVPTFNGQLRSHKPILLYWLQMSAYQVFGQSEFTARLPSALAACLSVLSLAWLAGRLAGERAWLGPTGFWSGAVLATCTLFVMAGRAATPDGCLIACSTLGMAAIVGGLLIEPSKRSQLATTILKNRLGWGWATVGYLALGGAILAKGPVGLILPMLIIHTWWLLVQRPSIDTTKLPAQRWRRMLIRVWAVANPSQIWQSLLALRSIPGVLLAILVAAPWYIAVGLATDGQFLTDFLWRHNVGRAISSMEGHDGGIFFYPIALLVGTFPWSLWLIPIAWWGIRAKRRGAAARTNVTLAGVWIGVTVLAFTFASTKLPSYITSCYPGVALLVGGFLKDFAADVRMPSRGWRTLAGGVAVSVAFCLASGLIWFSFAEALPLVGWVGCSSVLLAMAGVGGWIADWQNRPRWVPAIWLVAAIGLHVGLFGVGTRTVDSYRSEVDMLLALDEQATEQSRWFGLGGMEPSWVYYLDKPIDAVSDDMLQSIDKREQWQNFIQAERIETGDHLIVEGEIAERLQQASARWSSSDTPLVEIARTERFLRPGNIVVYQFISPTGQLAVQPDSATTTR